MQLDSLGTQTGQLHLECLKGGWMYRTGLNKSTVWCQIPHPAVVAYTSNTHEHDIGNYLRPVYCSRAQNITPNHV